MTAPYGASRPNARRRAAAHVPLTEEALAVLERARELTGGEGLIFPGSRAGQPLSDMTLSKRMKAPAFKDADGRDAVPHGLRAGFKTLSRTTPRSTRRWPSGPSGMRCRGDVQKAYDRATMVEKRRRLMAQWADYLTGAGKGQVVRAGRAARLRSSAASGRSQWGPSPRRRGVAERGSPVQIGSAPPPNPRRSPCDGFYELWAAGGGRPARLFYATVISMSTRAAARPSAGQIGTRSSR